MSKITAAMQAHLFVHSTCLQVDSDAADRSGG